MADSNDGDERKSTALLEPRDNDGVVDGVNSGASTASTAQLLYTGLAVALSAALLRAGLFNSVLVVAVSALLLCNPWVRTLLELPSQDGRGRFGKYDPARFLLSSAAEDVGNASIAEAKSRERTNLESSTDSIPPNRQLLALSVLPQPLHDSSQKMIRLIIRDFVQNWYDSNTFAHPNFLVSAEAGISHLAASVYLRAQPLESANVAAEVLLTVQSVLLSSLRRRRILARTGSRPTSPSAAYGAAAAMSHSTWPNTTARIDSLRKAVRKLLARNLPQTERTSPVVVLLLTEVVAKQAWQVVQNISDPDFINQKIVQLAEPASETSLEGQTLSPTEVEHMKNVAAQPSNLQPPTLPQQPLDSIDHRDLQQFPVMEPDHRPRPPSLPPRSSTKPLPQPRVTPPRKAQTIGPFSALGGLATGALGALADAAERAVDVVGGTVDEFGNLLVVPSDSTTRSGRGSPRRQTFGPVETNREPVSEPDSRARVDHLDMPPSVSQPPLPASIRQSMHAPLIQNPQEAEQDADRNWAFDIPDTPERGSFDAVPLVSPAPISAADASYDSFGPDDDSAATVLELLSDRGSSSYEAFENFLEDPANPYAAPNEGEMLLRLHTQLNTLASVMEFASLDEQTFRADASGILVKALDHLPGSLPPTYDGSQPVLVRRSAQQVLTNLEWCANMDVVEPLREKVVLRLAQLYRSFASKRMQNSGVASPLRVASPEAQPLKTFLDRENRSSFSSVDSDRPSLRYEPRKKMTAPSIPSHLAVQSPPRAPSVPPSAVMGPPPGPPRPMSVPPRAPSAPPRTSPGASRLNASKGEEPMPKPDRSDTHKPSVAVVDVSANAESPRSVDVRSFEVMIFVESVGANGDGFVLVRKWFEFEQVDAALQRLPRSSVTLPRLPRAKGMNSAQLCHVLEAYLGELLSPDVARHLANIGTTRSFFDRDRAGASTEDVRRKGGPGAFLGSIGKNIANVGKSAKIGFGVQSAGIDPASLSSGLATMRDASAVLTPKSTAPRQIDTTPKQRPATRIPEQGMHSSHDSPEPPSAQSDTSAFVSRASSPASRETSELSARDLDMILASIFAVADEAFNLQGGWTLRRGMLRVLEQVVRTTYASSVEATFNNAAAALNADKFAQWIEDLTNSFWPDGRWDTQRGRDRAEEAKYKTAERAREIVISYAPAQAGFMLGPGGKVACVKALASIHETLMDPITASDLGLSLVLKALDVASR